MAVKDYGTTYIIGFAVAVCLVCSIAVSITAVLLKDKQDINKVLDRQKKVLVVAGLVDEKDVKSLADEEVATLFDDNIVGRVIVLRTGEYDETIDARTFDQRRARQDPGRSSLAPANKAKVIRLPNHAMVYHVMSGDEVNALILPIEGYGLWSTLYGYIALDKDANTVKGITFYEHGETPGLGGEVDNANWKAKWPGRKLRDASGEIALALKKGAAGTPEQDPNHVDALSGATITTNGVTNLIHFWMGENGFGPYLDRFEEETS